MSTATLFLLFLSTSLFSWATANQVIVEFNQVDRQVPEDAGPCDVEIVKRGKLQEDLMVRVRALTIDQYEAMTGNIFDVNINPAEIDDFESIELKIPFESAGPLRQAKRVEVPIVNDDIHEEYEEFLLYYDVVGSNNLDTVIFSPMRNPLHCRIMNDDILTVTFEKNSYTVPEGSNLQDQVLITKNGVSTEEDIEITITAISQGATLGEDFITSNGNPQFELVFSAEQDKIGIPINIPSNDVTEGSRDFRLLFSIQGVDSLKTDIVLAQVTIEDTTVPSPTPPTTPPPSSSPVTTTPSPTPSSPPPLPSPEATVVLPSASSFPVVTNIPQEGSECPTDKKDIGLAIGLTFLLTFLLTVLVATIIIIFVVIVDRRRRDQHHIVQQLS